MKYFVTGAAGQLGRAVVDELLVRGHDVVATSARLAWDGPKNVPYVPLDIAQEQAVLQALTEAAPDVVIHCAAWTNVDSAEEPQNIAQVYAVNRDGTRFIARACKVLGCKMVHISTEYVFDGSGDAPWTEEQTPQNPRNVYGQSKLAGEEAVRAELERFFVVRISWGFGMHGKNFVQSMLQLSRTHDTLRVVNDQIGIPTYMPDAARLLVDMSETEKYGVYHVTNEGPYVSRAAFAEEIFRQAHAKTTVIPVTTEEYGVSRAVRPKNSRLSREKLREAGFQPLPMWQDALRRYLQTMQDEGR